MHWRELAPAVGRPQGHGDGHGHCKTPTESVPGLGGVGVRASLCSLPCKPEDLVPLSPHIRLGGPLSGWRGLLWGSPGRGQPQGSDVGDPGSVWPEQGDAPLGTCLGRGRASGGQTRSPQPRGGLVGAQAGSQGTCSAPPALHGPSCVYGTAHPGARTEWLVGGDTQCSPP